MHTLCLRDPAFLAATGSSWTPDPTDPDIQGWWKATDLITLANNVIGDKTSATTNKTSTLAPNFNLFIGQSGADYSVLPTGTDVCNYMKASQDLTSAIWLSADATKDDATHITFGNTNGRVLQYAYHMLPTDTWKLTITARRVSGNTNIEILHQDSTSGNSTAIVLTGSLADYTATFNGPASLGTLVRVGVRDPNGAGFGQIEVTKWHLRRSEHSSTYVATDTTDLYRKGGTRDGAAAWSTPPGALAAPTSFNTPAVRANSPPFTLYAAIWPYYTNIGTCIWVMAPTIWGFLVKLETGPPSGRLATYDSVDATWQYSAAPNVATARQWQILTIVHNGASSSQRINLNAATATTHNAGSPAVNAWSFGSDAGFSAGGPGHADWHEVITAYSAHDATTQEQYIRYLADQVGITV